MQETKFKLPGSSLKEVEKIVEAYGQKDGPTSNEEIAQVAGVNPTTISRNNGFLSAAGLISGGQKKEVTELGKNLANALHHEQRAEVARFWRKAVSQSPFLSEQLTAVRVQRGVKKDEFPKKLLYNLNLSQSSHSEVGARAVSDLLVAAGLLKEEDGVLKVPTGDESKLEAPPGEEPEKRPVSTQKRSESSQQPLSSPQPFQIAINIQLQLTEFEDPKKYEELFLALRKHLLKPDES